MNSLSFVVLVLSIFFSIQVIDGTKRLHRGPRREHGVKILCGHALAGVDTEKLKKMGLPSSHYGRHVVDFNLHLMHDVVMWEELEADNVNIDRCKFRRRSRTAVVKFIGQLLDISDFRPGTIFAIEQAEFEIACRQNLPTYPDIDDEDNYSFFRIWKVVRAGRHGIEVYMKLIPGRHVIPAVDIHVHREKASSSEIENLNEGVVYDNDNDDDEIDDEDDMGVDTARVARWKAEKNYNQVPVLPISDRLSLLNKRVPIKGLDLLVSADVNVKISSIRLRRLSRLQFEWDQEFEGKFETSLFFTDDSFKQDRTGELIRWFIPGLSFKLGIPLIGKLRAGAFAGINWITRIDASSSVRLYFKAQYKRKQKVKAQLLPPEYDAEDVASGNAASAELTYTSENRISARLKGFYGLRPVIGAGITYTKKKVSFKRFKIKVTKETKSVDGNLGAEVGIEIQTAAKSPPFEPYSGSGLKLGVCDSCHLAQGAAFFKGQKLSVQAVSGNVVTKEKVLVPKLFEVRLATVCLGQQTCF